MTDTTRLLPCPFCGGTDIHRKHDPENVEYPHWIGCMNADCLGPHASELSAERCTETWNRRSALAASADAGQQEPLAHISKGAVNSLKLGKRCMVWLEPVADAFSSQPLYATPAPAQADPTPE